MLHTHTHTHTHIYMCVCVCVCVCPIFRCACIDTYEVRWNRWSKNILNFSLHTHTHTHTHTYPIRNSVSLPLFSFSLTLSLYTYTTVDWKVLLLTKALSWNATKGFFYHQPLVVHTLLLSVLLYLDLIGKNCHHYQIWRHPMNPSANEFFSPPSYTYTYS